MQLKPVRSISTLTLRRSGFFFAAVVEEDMPPLTSSLPDGLNNMAGSHSTTDGSNPRQDKKRLSIRWRTKLAGQNAAPTADSD